MQLTDTTPAVSTRALSDMRDVLEETGVIAAQTAPAQSVVSKIENTWPGGVAGWLTAYGYDA